MQREAPLVGLAGCPLAGSPISPAEVSSSISGQRSAWCHQTLVSPNGRVPAPRRYGRKAPTASSLCRHARAVWTADGAGGLWPRQDRTVRGMRDESKHAQYLHSHDQALRGAGLVGLGGCWTVTMNQAVTCCARRNGRRCRSKCTTWTSWRADGLPWN